MNTLNRKRLRAAGLFIVILAMTMTIYTYWKSDKGHGINSRESDKYYEEMTNTSKIRLDVDVTSMDAFKQLISTDFDANGAVKLSSEERKQYSLYIYQVHPQQINTFLAELTKIGSVTSKVEKTTPNSSQIDLEAKLKDRETMYSKAFQDYNNSNNQTSSQKEKIDILQTEIDSLKYQIVNQKNMNMTLFYIKARVAGSQEGKLEQYKNLGISFVRNILILILALALLYFGTILLAYIFSLLGIKFPSLANILGKGYNDYAGYKGYRGYGSYGYGGSKKRRIKRIYRNKHTSGAEPEEDKEP